MNQKQATDFNPNDKSSNSTKSSVNLFSVVTIFLNKNILQRFFCVFFQTGSSLVFLHAKEQIFVYDLKK